MRDLPRIVLTAIGAASRRLANVGIESSLLDAELLMAETAGVTREAVITGWINPSSEILYKFETLVARREMREPIAYILGHKEFYSLDFEVTPAVLIPRPETEFVVSTALECIAGKANARVLDIGTGSDALAVASRNARRHRVEDRVTFRRADCFNILDDGATLRRFDAIVSNPPYLDDAEITALEPEVRRYEPRVALSGGVGGLRVIRRISNGAGAHLEADGQLVMEMGTGHAGDVLGIMAHAGLRVGSVINDLAGQMRVARARSVR
jgi:release factor glutamine methyltransferase